MKLKENVFYKTRSGEIAIFTGDAELNDTSITIWPCEGFIITEKGTKAPMSWTSFGGASASWNIGDTENSHEYIDEDDIVLELTKEDYPEYYL